MNIYLIRHGVTLLNKQQKVNAEVDEPLALEGIEQAKAVASEVPKSVKYIYSSPLLRARQMAEIISSKCKLPVLVADELTEIKMGSLAGKSWQEMPNGMELKRMHRSVNFDYTPFGGESSEQVKKRIISLFKKIKNTHSDNEVLFVTHGGVIRVIALLEQRKVEYETAKHASLLECDAGKILLHSKG